MNLIQLVAAICVQLMFIYNESKCHATSPAQSSGGDNTEPERVQLNTNELDAIEFLRQFNDRAGEIYYQDSLAEWNFHTNKSGSAAVAYNLANTIKSDFLKQAGKNASQFDSSNFNQSISRQLGKLLDFIGDAALETDDFQKLKEVLLKMKDIRSQATMCKPNGECFDQYGLNKILAESRNFDEVTWAWKAWRDAVGPPNLDYYEQYVDLKNKAAILNNQTDCGALWRSEYEEDNLEEVLDLLYEQIEPLYQQLHAYVRRKLHGVYGDDYINLKGPIPVPVTGDQFARDWGNLIDICLPYPNKTNVDFSEVFKQKNYTALKMFQVAEDFFVSLGLLPMPEEFWNISYIEKPDRDNFLCHPKAQDFNNQKDFGIMMCTELNQYYFNTIHHEMGHTQYQLQYKNLPILFRASANPGFHEAAGDVLTLSVNTPKHLMSIGLLDEVTDDLESDLNQLMNIALDKVALIPFALLLDKWRWDVFSGKTAKTKYNEEYWKLRLKHQGVIPPIPRSSTDFDPATKLHILYDAPYVAYFVSKILEFQFHEGLCNASGHIGPLHKCDIYGSKEAGRIWANMLKKGSSVPWPDALESITGQRVMDASPIVRYFQPLMDYLIEENNKTGDVIGWPDTKWMPRGSNSRGQRLSTPLHELIILTIIYMLIR